MKEKKKFGLTEPEMLAVKAFLEKQAEAVKPLVMLDGGTCVLGNAVAAYVVPKGCRKPRVQALFRNCWTQGEQPEALRALLEAAKKEFPALAAFMFYDAGIMD